MESFATAIISSINSQAGRAFRNKIRVKYEKDKASMISEYSDGKKSPNYIKLKETNRLQLLDFNKVRLNFLNSFVLIITTPNSLGIKPIEQLSYDIIQNHGAYFAQFGINTKSPTIIKDFENCLLTSYDFIFEDLSVKHVFKDEVILHQVFGLEEILHNDFEEIKNLDEIILHFHLNAHYVFGEDL